MKRREFITPLSGVAAGIGQFAASLYELAVKPQQVVLG